jgi:hypothetical protein
MEEALFFSDQFSLCALPSLHLLLLPYLQPAPPAFSLSEWEIRSFVKAFLADIPVIDFQIQKTSKQTTLLLTFENQNQWKTVKDLFFQPKYHIIGSMKVRLQLHRQEQPMEDNQTRNIKKNRSLWIRDLPLKLLELPSPPEPLTEEHLVWRMLSAAWQPLKIERMELANHSKGSRNEFDSFSDFQRDLCVRFSSSEDFLRALSSVTGLGDLNPEEVDPNNPTRSLLMICQPSEAGSGSGAGRYIHHLQVTPDTEGFLRTHKRHQRERARERSLQLQQKLRSCLVNAERDLTLLQEDFNALSDGALTAEAEGDEDADLISHSMVRAKAAVTNFSAILEQQQQRCQEDQKVVTDQMLSRIRSTMTAAREVAECSMQRLQGLIESAHQRRDEKLRDLETLKTRQLTAQRVEDGENCLQDLESKCSAFARLAHQHDAARSQHVAVLALSDPSWLESPPLQYSQQLERVMKQSKALLAALRKLLSKEKERSSAAVQTCCDMLRIEWAKVETQVKTMQTLFDIEANLFPLFEQIQFLWRMPPHSAPIQAIISSCLSALSDTLRRNNSFLVDQQSQPTEGEDGSLSADWINSLLLTSVAVRGLVDPLCQHLARTEREIEIAETYVTASSKPYAEGVRSALNRTHYRLARLESLARSVLEHRVSASTGKDLSSFANSCAVSDLELSAAVLEVELAQMGQEDRWSQLRREEEIAESEREKKSRLDLSLEDRRSSLCGKVWSLERMREALLKQRERVSQQRGGGGEETRWKSDAPRSNLEVPLWREDEGSKRMKRKRLSNGEAVSISLMSQIGHCPTAQRKEEEQKLREVLLERLKSKSRAGDVDNEVRMEREKGGGDEEKRRERGGRRDRGDGKGIIAK